MKTKKFKDFKKTYEQLVESKDPISQLDDIIKKMNIKPTISKFLICCGTETVL